MLDGVHRLMLRGVDRGVAKPDWKAPALENLIATGMVERRDDVLTVTDLGHEVLRRSEAYGPGLLTRVRAALRR